MEAGIEFEESIKPAGQRLRHAAGHETADARMAVEVVFPDDRRSGEVGLPYESAVGHHNPFAIDANAIFPAIGLPIRIGDDVSIGIGSFQAFEPPFQRRIRVAAVVTRDSCRREQQQTNQDRGPPHRQHFFASAISFQLNGRPS